MPNDALEPTICPAAESCTLSALHNSTPGQIAAQLVVKHQEDVQMNIRRFKTGDEAALLEIYRSAIHLIARRDYTEEQINAWAPAQIDGEYWANRMRGINPFVSEIDGNIVGYADVQVNGYIEHFFVSGSFPRQGIGRSLMDAIECEAMALKITELTSDVSRTAQPFFKSFGFEIIEQRSPLVRGVEVPNALMRKIIRVRRADA